MNCSQCSGSYFLNGNSECQQCAPSCSKCTSAQQCQACASSAYLLLGQSCQLCYSLIENCLTCESETSCLSCLSNYYLSQGQCVRGSGGMSAWFITLIVLSLISIFAAIGTSPLTQAWPSTRSGRTTPTPTTAAPTWRYNDPFICSYSLSISSYTLSDCWLAWILPYLYFGHQ